MAANEDHINYTAADFQRYHSGDMSAAEMHAIEKAALEDPFLADALDGYAFTQTAAEDIRELSEQIPPKENKKEKAPVISFNNQWLRIAAMLILVGGVTFIGYRISHRENIPETFAQKETTSPVVQDATVSSQGKTTAPVSIDTVSFAALEKSKVVSPQQIVTPSTGNVKEDFVVSPASPAPSKWEEYDRISEEKKESALASAKSAAKDDIGYKFTKPSYNLKGRVMDENGSPIVSAQVVVAHTKNVVVTDASGNFVLPVNDSILIASISAPGYTYLNQNLNTNQYQNIVLPRNNTMLSEVVVTSLGVQRQRKDLGYATAKVNNATMSENASANVANGLQGRVSGLNVTNSGPSAGAAFYQNYIVDSLRRPVSPDSNKVVRGNVILSFKVNKKGTPVKVQVIQSLCQLCDKEAIRILENGPKWNSTGNKRIQTTITF